MTAGRHPHTALVNGRAIAVDPGETLLHAALRQGVAIPFSCRVGGCATCKCTLVEGRVKELTETGYLLTDDELDRGVVLACQSVPQTDVRVEVDLARHGELRSVAGRVVGQRRLTHDITALRIQLDQGLPYRAGQSARVSLGALPGVARPDSFATPVAADGQVDLVEDREVVGLRRTADLGCDFLGSISIAVDHPGQFDVVEGGYF